MIISRANWYSWDHDVLLQLDVFTPIVQLIVALTAHARLTPEPNDDAFETRGSLLYFVLQITVSLPSSSLILAIRPHHVFTP